MNNSGKHLPKNASILFDMLSDNELSVLVSFIDEKVPEGDASVSLRYRPDEWDNSGVIQKIYNLSKEYLKENYEVHSQVEPREFIVRRVLDASDIGEEYGDYDANGEILYYSTVSVPGLDGCIGGETKYLKYDVTVSPNDRAICIHRGESNNDWKVSKIDKGSRLDLVILFQEISRKVSYSYSIDQITENLPDF